MIKIFDNCLILLAIILLSNMNLYAQPAKPSLTVSSTNPTGLDDVTFIGSAPSESIDSATLMIAADADFTKNYLTFANTPDTASDLTTFVVNNDRFPFNIPLYFRLSYGTGGVSSTWSDGVMITMGHPLGLQSVYVEDFESVAVNSIPEGWDVFTTTNDIGPQGSYYNPELIQWVVKDVPFLNTLLYYPSYSDPGVVETDLLIADKNTLVAESGDYVDAQNFYESHIITHEFDFSGVTNIVLAFNSNYIQNQDNIAIIEYSLDNGSIDISDGADIPALPIGNWYPVMYYLDSGSDVIYDANGNLDVNATLSGTDDKDFFWSEYMFADDNPAVGPDVAASFILPRLDDGLMGPGGVNGEYDSKRWERFRIPGLDNQSSVKFRFTYTGSWSWFWTIDNLQIFGDDGTNVSDWSLF